MLDVRREADREQLIDREQVRLEQLRLLFDSLSTGLVVNILNALMVSVVFWTLAPHTLLLGWFGGLLGVSLWRWRLLRRYDRMGLAGHTPAWWLGRFVLGSLATGLLWGGIGFLFLYGGDLQRFLLVFVIAGMAAGATITLSAYWPAALSFVVSATGLLTLRLLTSGLELAWAMGGMALLYMAAAVIVGRRSAHATRETIVTRILYQQTERQLRHSHDRNRLLLNSAVDGIFGIDAEGNTTFVNPAAERLLGYRAEELVGHKNHGLIHHSHANGIPYPEEECRMTAVMRDGMPREVDDEVFWHKAGHSIPVEYASTPITEDGHITGAVVSFRDISRRKRAEALLLEERSLFIAGPTIIFKWRAEEGWPVEYVSPNVHGQLGYRPEQLTSGEVAFADIVHPDDLQRVAADVARFSSEGIEHFEQEYRLLDADGEYRWVYDFTSVRRGVNGNISHYFGYLIDISARKQSEEALHLAATAFEAHEAIAVTDAEGTILRVNQAFTDITGYHAEEVIGNNPRILASGRHDGMFYNEMWRTLNASGYWEGEIWNRRKNGEVYPEWLAITAVKGSDGTISHYLAHFQDISERKAAEQRIIHQAHYDELTNLPNRRLFIERLEQELSRSRRHAHVGAVLFIDLDRFKPINDSLGHDVGDAVLCEVAERLRAHLRAEDTAARLGGDEFVVLLSELGDDTRLAIELAEEAADKLRHALAQPYPVGSQELHLSSSIGISLFPDAHENAQEIVKQADIAMYHAKEEGRDSTRLYLPSMQAQADARLLLETELYTALHEEQLLLYYQPQVDRDGRLQGAEALLRWQHPTRGLLTPEYFLPVLESSGLQLEVGRWVLETACRQIAAWAAQLEGKPPGCVAVNVNPHQLAQPGFSVMVMEILAETGANPGCLELEITEEMLLSDTEETIAKIAVLSELGVRFAIDDFGTGYSSLAYLKRLPVGKLKIDRVFVTDIDKNENDRTIADTIVAMARHMKLKVLAEGVENEAQFELLNAMGCDSYQGYYFSKPLSVAEFEACASQCFRGERKV